MKQSAGLSDRAAGRCTIRARSACAITELADLNKEAMELVAKIQENSEELGA